MNYYRGSELIFFSDADFTKNLYDYVSSGIWIANENDVIFYANKSMAQIVGISKEQLEGLKIPDGFSIETMEFFYPLYLKAKNSLKPVKYKSIHVVTPQNRDSLQSGWLIPVINNNIFKGIACIVDDITYETRYIELFSHTKNCVAVYRAVNNGEDFIIEDFNKSALNTEKVKKRDIIGKKITEVFPGVKEFGLFEVLQKVYKTGVARNHSISLYSDGRISGWRENHVYKIYTGEVITVYNDLTEAKKSEENLLIAKERLQLAQACAGLGIWDWDFKTGRLEWSPELFKMIGLDPKKDKAGFNNWKKAMHPDDLKAAEKNIDEAVKKRIPLSAEQRVIFPSGEVHWIKALGDSKYDDKGRPIRMVGICMDITEQIEDKKTILQSSKSLRKTLKQTINSLASIVEIKDPYTSGHQKRVQKLSSAIAKELKLSAEMIESVKTAAIIHDIGKIMIPASILSKPSKLNDLEYLIIKGHPKAGYDIIKHINFKYNIKDIVLQHHEKLNGSGYPNSLKGPQIMKEAKIIAVADIVEAMSSHRPYRPSLGIKKALLEIKKGIGTLYDSEVVNACIKIIDEKKFQF